MTDLRANAEVEFGSGAFSEPAPLSDSESDSTEWLVLPVLGVCAVLPLLCLASAAWRMTLRREKRTARTYTTTIEINSEDVQSEDGYHERVHV